MHRIIYIYTFGRSINICLRLSLAFDHGFLRSGHSVVVRLIDSIGYMAMYQCMVSWFVDKTLYSGPLYLERKTQLVLRPPLSYKGGVGESGTVKDEVL